MSDAGSLIQLLLARLERISADSPMAHRASGVRGALLRFSDDPGAGNAAARQELERSLDAAVDILSKAAALRAGRPSTRRPT